MNYLQLVQQLRQECGISGNPPLTVLGQVGETKRLVDWINAAWLEIQGMQDSWGFMRKTFNFNIVPNVGDYTVDGGYGVGANILDLRYWYRDTFRIYDTSIGTNDEQFLVEWEYLVFRNTYRFQSQVPSRPVVFSINPREKELLFGPVPDKEYTVVGEYQKVPTPLTDDSSVPDLPAHLHMIIVYKAMEYYALFESASEVLFRSERMFKSLLNQLSREELPIVTLGESLA
jgi:hypothetical protein